MEGGRYGWRGRQGPGHLRSWKGLGFYFELIGKSLEHWRALRKGDLIYIFERSLWLLREKNKRKKGAGDYWVGGVGNFK